MKNLRRPGALAALLALLASAPGCGCGGSLFPYGDCFPKTHTPPTDEVTKSDSLPPAAEPVPTTGTGLDAAALAGRWDGACVPSGDHALRTSYDFGDGTDGVTLLGWVYADKTCSKLAEAVTATGRYTQAGAQGLALDFGHCSALEAGVGNDDAVTAACKDAGLSTTKPTSYFRTDDVEGESLRLDDQTFKRRGS